MIGSGFKSPCLIFNVNFLPVDLPSPPNCCEMHVQRPARAFLHGDVPAKPAVLWRIPPPNSPLGEAEAQRILLKHHKLIWNEQTDGNWEFDIQCTNRVLCEGETQLLQVWKGLLDTKRTVKRDKCQNTEIHRILTMSAGESVSHACHCALAASSDPHTAQDYANGTWMIHIHTQPVQAYVCIHPFIATTVLNIDFYCRPLPV